MASRRLEGDRFFTEDFNEETYTAAGLKLVEEVTSMRDVLNRHFGEGLDGLIGEGQSAFKPSDEWPAEPNGTAIPTKDDPRSLEDYPSSCTASGSSTDA